MADNESNIPVGYTAIEDDKDMVRIHIDVEDAEPEDISLDVHQTYIDVLATLEEDVEFPEGITHRQGEIYRHINLPGNVDVDNLECVMEDGHLDLIIPKAI